MCIRPCSEGALVLENGKVKIVKEELCDGAGLCIGECPAGALKIEKREAPVFTPRAILPLDKVNNDINCLLCAMNEEEAYLLQLRKTGEKLCGFAPAVCRASYMGDNGIRTI